MARRNAARLGLARRVEFVLSDLFADVGERPFDLVVSNPPYIPPTSTWRSSPTSATTSRAWRCTAGWTGWTSTAAWCPAPPCLLRPGGTLALEVGAGQADAVAEIVDAAGAYEAAARRGDLSGVPRVVYAPGAAHGTGADVRAGEDGR